MAYSPQNFYGPTAPQYPPTPNPQNDEFSPMNYYPHDFTQFSHFEAIPQNHATIMAANPSPMPRKPTPPSDQATRGARGSSEEKEMTPSQRRRKEQNRAAQRAFRERKERHVKELESRLSTLQQVNSRTLSENGKLKEELEKTKLENRLLHESNMRSQSSSEPPTEVGPMVFKPQDPGQQPPQQFTAPLFLEHPNRGPLHRISTSPKTGEKLLGAGAAWDLIVCHPLYEKGLVDIADISDRLKGLARCDGQGPVFEESVVLEAIQTSVGSGTDELLVDGLPDY